MKSASVVIMEAADMSVGMTGHLGMLLSEELEIGTVMTVDSITIPAEVSVSSAEYPRVVEVGVVEVAEDPTLDLLLAEIEVTDLLLVVMVAVEAAVMVAAMVDVAAAVVATTITIMVTTGIAPHVISATLLKGMSA